MNLKVKLLSQTAKLPTRGSTGAAGLDLYADLGGEGEDGLVAVICDEPTRVPTGIAVQIPTGHVGIIKGRSGLATRGVVVLGGVIDSDYTGPVMVVLSSVFGRLTLRHGDRIAQLLILPCPVFEPVQVDELGDTERGGGGFGSTGR